MWGRFDGQGPIRLVPEAYRTLPLAAKIVYCIHHNVDVWDQQLRYFKGAETAAVDSKNMPLKDFSFDSNGALVSYAGTPGSWSDILAGLQDPALRFKVVQGYYNTRYEVQKLIDLQNVERKYVKNWK